MNGNRETRFCFYLRPQRKIGYPDCSIRQFFKIFGFWENSLPACNLGEIPKIIFAVLVVKCKKLSLVIQRGMKNSLKKFEFRPSTFTENCAWLSREKIFEKLSSTDKYFLKKCAWYSRGKNILKEILRQTPNFLRKVSLVKQRDILRRCYYERINP